MVINLNPATTADANATGNIDSSGNFFSGNGNGGGNGNGNGSGNFNGIGGNTNTTTTSNLMGIISHVLFEGNVYLHVVYAGEMNAKWITLSEGMAYCPTGVVAYIKLQLAEIYGVPIDLFF
ncbi:uncharacterized protein LOC108110025 [Drosophila eugracilis]|uniref:uncharacterized protein LOC108110025 n=1 Tax=Drosophila eugracilis TaxID=29029 RepID=UPI001BDABB3F|nr:uncharacterized protein LOC108110025 [Drosophila eugracilis]XP_017074358.2 uncharacterized protein LOC108110025 [Drosophila eugracilis]